ncbi:beta strand repeat-containing protein [Rhodopila globiformis]|uniref:DUF4214 domain-containing protein n=1 Tax=Rhodopila globiformis TaxID=1071 RepID=A0A2S6NBT9_RHOGL|nr:DUF4214 domain-containing protein [Rhodopila globiformis]PPQ32067.1 hypothetical protein CCS01_16030 [Rhodopila globiformis]
MVTTANTVQGYYTTILNRPATPEEVTTWSNLLDSNALTSAQVQGDLANSFESHNNVAPIVEMFQGALNRLPAQTGLYNWVQLADSGTLTMAQVEADIAGSPESQKLYGTTVNQTFLNALYENALGRAPEAGALQAWQALNLTTAEIEVDVSLSPEALKRATLPVSSFLVNAVNNPTTAYTGTLYSSSPTGSTFTLTTGIDTPALTGDNNVVSGTANGTGATYTPGDTIVAPAGSTGNTLNLSDISTGGTWITATTTAGITVSNIQTLNLVSGEAVGSVDTASSIEGFSGLTALNIKDVGGTAATAAPTTAIAVNDLAAAGNNETIDGGSNVTLTAAGVTTGGAIAIGGTTAPTGTITATINDAAPANGSNQIGSTIATTGGTTVNVTQNIAAPAGGQIGSWTATGGTIGITGTSTTTSASVTQTAPVSPVAGVAASGGTTAVDTVTWAGFGIALPGTQTIGGVTVTSDGSATFTPNQVAAVANGASIAGLSVTGLGVSWTVTGPTDLSVATSTFTDVTANTAASLVGTGIATGSAIDPPLATVVTAGSGSTAAVTGVGGVADGAVTITDANGTSSTAAGTITSASLNNYGAGATIKDNALANLALAGTGGGVTLTDALTTPTATTLNLAANGVTDSTGITDTNNEIATLNVTTGGTTASTLGGFADTGLKTLNVSGTQNLTLGGTTPATTVAVSGGAGLGITLGANTTFTSTSTGTDVVTISAPATKTITGNGSAKEEIIWNSATAPAATTYLGTVSGFKVLGLGSAVTGGETFDLSKITGFTGLDVQANANAGVIQVTNVAPGSPLSIDGAFAGTLVYQTSDTAGPTDSLGLTLGAASNQAGFTVAGLTVEDSSLNGIGTLNVTSNASTTAAANTVTTLHDASLTALNVAGTGGLTIGSALTTNASALTINGTSSGTAGITLTGLAAANLATLTLTGTDAIALGTVTDGTNGITVNGSADNANVSLTLGGATASGKTDSVTLGNGTNSVTDTAATTGATVNITAGTGANTVTLGAAATNNVTFGTHSTTATTDNVKVAGSLPPGTIAPTAIITGLNTSGADTITFVGDSLANGTVTAYTAAQINTFGNNPTTLAGAVAGVLAGGGGDLAQHGIGAFQFQGNTYLVEQAGAIGSNFANPDTVVELTGAHTLTSASTATAGVLHLVG